MNRFSIILVGSVLVAVAVALLILRGRGEAPGDGSLHTNGANGREEENVNVLKSPAPDFLLQDYNGAEVRLSDFRGRAVVVNSWAAWCPFCRKELVDFAKAQNDFSDQVVFISIDRAETLEVAKRYTDGLGVSDKLIFLLDPQDSFYRSIGGFSMPETIFVDKEGNIRQHKRGPMDSEEIHRRVEALLRASYSYAMVDTLRTNEHELYQCRECGTRYRDLATAERCEAWCREHKSCNLEIIKDAVQDD